MSKYKLNHEAWARSMIGFIRERGMESEFKDWCGGWPCPVTSPDAAPQPEAPAEVQQGVAKAIFLAAHADGWRGNQLRRDVQHVDAEKSWELFVSHGALGKILATPQQQERANERPL